MLLEREVAAELALDRLVVLTRGLRRLAQALADGARLVVDVLVLADAVDVTMFPTPKWHDEDGGRYIGTGSFNVTRDPDEGWINCGTYRVMIHDKQI